MDDLCKKRRYKIKGPFLEFRFDFYLYGTIDPILSHIKPMLRPYRNQAINLHCKLIDWILYECYIGMGWCHLLRLEITTVAKFGREIMFAE